MSVVLLFCSLARERDIFCWENFFTIEIILLIDFGYCVKCDVKEFIVNLKCTQTKRERERVRDIMNF